MDFTLPPDIADLRDRVNSRGLPQTDLSELVEVIRGRDVLDSVL